MNRLFERYQKEIAPKLMTEFNIANRHAVPRLLKITVNVGFGRAMGDQKVITAVVNNLTQITGQKPVLTKAHKSISNFKLKQGMVVGAMVTLRRQRMYDFLDKLIHSTLPRVRDFQGIARSAVDAEGNLNIGFKEHIVFPEVKSDSIDYLHGLEVAVTTTAHDRVVGTKLFELLGIPFKK